ncbi:MAG: low molecular weight phosphotyrosine protein phosphatase, partial [Muribaculaceae bacterium]|nr:low molecular weight phosphotyrosine protein phosphatase [Muribaculaceae bacterium]
RMRVHARNRDIELTHRCRQVDVEDFNDFDLIIGMDASNLQNLRRMAPSVEAARKIRAMAEFFSPGARYDHVPDPYYEGSEGFELVLDLLDDGCRNLFNRYGGI